MKRSETFEILISNAREVRDEASRSVGQATVALQNSGAKLELLNQYRRDYIARMHDEFSTLRGVAVLSRLGTFLAKLDEAIGQQTADVDWHQQVVDKTRSTLMAAERRLRSLEVYIARQATVAAQAERRREQKQTDEYAARAVARSSRSAA